MDSSRGYKRETSMPLMDSELIKRKTSRGEIVMDKESAGGEGNEGDEMSTSSISSYRVNHLIKEELQHCVMNLIEAKLEVDGNESEEALKIVLDHLPNMPQLAAVKKSGKAANYITRYAK